MNSPSRSDLSPDTPERRTPGGHAARDLFQLSPDLIHLNHGSYGAVPKIVAAEQERWRAHIEKNPTGFFKDELPNELRRLAGVAAQRFDGAAKDWVFVENATSAVNSVLSSLPGSRGTARRGAPDPASLPNGAFRKTGIWALRPCRAKLCGIPGTSPGSNGAGKTGLSTIILRGPEPSAKVFP